MHCHLVLTHVIEPMITCGGLTHWGLVVPFGCVMVPFGCVMANVQTGSTLAKVMACCLTAPSHYFNQCWLIISKVLGAFIWWHHSLNLAWNYLPKIKLKSSRGQWVNSLRPTDSIWHQWTGSSLGQAMNCLAPRHYVNQYRLIVFY